MTVHVSFRVNGRPVETDVPDNRLLMDTLRYEMDLTGTKLGCGVGVCGACTVLVDGEPWSACLTLAVQVQNRSVLSIEGLAPRGSLHPLQRAFIEQGGFQCGFCTPGQILAASALLAEHPRPTDEQIVEGMLGNLCRCTGYYKIVDSIKHAAAEMAADGSTPEGER